MNSILNGIRRTHRFEYGGSIIMACCEDESCRRMKRKRCCDPGVAPANLELIDPAFFQLAEQKL